MKRLLFTYFILFLTGILILFTSSGLGQTQSKSATLSTAGGTTQSQGYKLISLVGQTVQPGGANSINFKLYGSLSSITRDLENPVIVSVTSFTTSQTAGQDVEIKATITDNVNVDQGTLHYREGGSTSFSTVVMDTLGGTYNANIPGSTFGSKGVDYYVSATDVNSNGSYSDVYSAKVAIADSGIVRNAPQNAGSAQNAYRLISIPVNATDKTPAAVLEDNFGAYNNTKWRFYELQNDQSYVEHPNTSNMSSGKAFWLIVKDADKTVDTGPGNTNLTDTTFSISLAPGYTLVGNPFNFNIPFANVKMENDSALKIHSYTGEWNNYNGAFIPFEGYAVYSEVATNLVIDPNVGGTPGQAPKPLAPKTESNCVITIEATCQEAHDADAQAVTKIKASTGYDRFDWPEPPVIGEYVSVYFPHPEWNKVSKNYCIDVRPELDEGDIWQFEVKTNINDKVNLTFKGMDNVPPEYEVWLIDEMLKVSQNLREKNNYDIGANQNHQKQLILAVGTSAFIEEKFNEYNLIPATYQLFQNFPNPFNPVTTIRYGLPKADKVSLKVYNLLGQEIATLMNNVDKKAGYHTIVWDGQNQHGRSVASGMYIYTLKSNKFSDVKKMLLVR